jgi:hypothetical protein
MITAAGHIVCACVCESHSDLNSLCHTEFMREKVMLILAYFSFILYRGH